MEIKLTEEQTVIAILFWIQQTNPMLYKMISDHTKENPDSQFIVISKNNENYKLISKQDKDIYILL